ncbi:MBL fold metallo-hydrolase [bacterium]|nr:MBL fold metallo-hydrolase [bacterium]
MQKNKFEILRMSPENTNSVLVSSGDDCIIFDPWGHAADWEQVLAARGLNLREIYATHGHPDHISAAPDLARRFNVPWYLHPADNSLIGWGNELLDFFQIPHIPADFVAPMPIAPGRHMVLGTIPMDVIATPGHTPGGVCYYFPNEKILLTGDTIFRDGFGRYDFPGGDARALFKSISQLHELNMPDDTYVVHGHGPDSTIDILKRDNPHFKKA